MATKPVETAVGFYADRTFSPRVAGDFAQTLEASGVVDMFQAWDQLISWWPNSMWTPENTAWTSLMQDCDSFADAFQLCAFAAAATTRLGVSTTTDAIRRGPAELLQTMLTLASATDGRAVFQFGAG